MSTYHDLERQKRQDEKDRSRASFNRNTRHITDPEGWARDQKTTKDNREKARAVGRALGLTDEQIKKHIQDQFSINLNVQFSDSALANCISYMTKDSQGERRK
jgi:hypothetical protein